MKILFFTHYFPPEGNAPASRTYDNCKRWVAAGHDVTVLTCAPNVPDGKVYEGYQNKLKQEEWVDGIRVIRVWTFIAANKGAVLRILNYLSYFVSAFFVGLFLRRPDVLICTSPQFFCGLVGVIVGRLRRLPRVLEIRDIWPESIQAVGAMKKSFLTRMLEWVELFMYRSANHVVTVGTGYRDKLLERGVPAAGMDVITNGADLKFYCPGEADDEFRKKYDLDGKFTVAYVGTIGMASGLEVALEASRKLTAEGDDSFRFLLVGDGAEREALQARAEAEGLKHVIFTGRLDKSFMPALLRSVEGCFIHLRKSDLFKTVLPSKLFEAFAVGRPVILGVDGNAREVLEAAEAGIFIEPGNADALIETVRKLRDDSALRDQFSENGLKSVTQHYNRDELANDYISVLETVVEGKQK
jgi:glycosyltransferase involved in cell wall biosynthesis